MSLVRFFTYQFILFSAVITFNLCIDPYLGKPFTLIDFIVIVISGALFYFGYKLIEKGYKRFSKIRLLSKILISIPAFLSAAVFVGLITNQLLH
ncbi:hypothetical protein M4D55_09580 [Metabacillus idriensis]|uniref:hypothetical protein n=1 Tax=Metabacillus idriensis TaxID=324768 RepID=UPI0008A9E4EE|nr:hypothetical protein [Metabacillus idriensis]MCM3596032.1 hypothetical protein [Metabacillus idriensis]OHR64102.1 hypothetical protein HMPREF3291_15700 [Bacillus sp. HMSC76G11]